MKTRHLMIAAILCTAAVTGASAETVATAHDDVLSGFLAPPASARPRVFWPWMNGNVTQAGIDADLAWMNRVGIAGLVTADAAIDTPQVVDRLVYMSPKWCEAFRHAAGLAARYRMDLGIDSSPGWSMTGGPWVQPQAAMKKLVWSRTDIAGGKPFHGVLPQPPSNIGPLQNLGWSGSEKPSEKTAALHFYRDSQVIAFPTPRPTPTPTALRSNAGPLDANVFADGDLTNGVDLAAPGTAAVWIEAEYRQPVTIQGVTLGLKVPNALGYRAKIEASDDGQTWRDVAVFPEAAQLQRFQIGEQTISFAPATARRFRLVLTEAAPLPGSLRPGAAAAPGAIAPASPPPPPARIYRVNELVFHAAATVHEFEKKAMFAPPPRDFYTLTATPDFAAGSAIDPTKVIVLNERMRADGTLDWTPPKGAWTVLRLGYSLTGKENHPAPVEATGLEVDKLSADAVRGYLETFLDTYKRVAGPYFGSSGLTTLMVDSSEAGQQNWTETLIAEFKHRRGYDPVPWLPALAGMAVKSPTDSDRFLWDFRKTVAEMFAENHYGTLSKVAHTYGLKIQGEALEDHRPTFGDDTAMRRYFDVPMGALWTYDTERFPASLTYEADVLGAASVAHIYGRKLIGAESLTSDRQPWAWGPRGLKPYIDMEFARGVNQVTIHTSVHQPTDQAPGLSLFGYGQFFNRHEAWSELAKPWLDYIARSSHLLQQGRFAADIAYFYGEEAPVTSLWGNKRIDDVPDGYGFDFFDADALLNHLETGQNGLQTPSGMRYRVLYLGGSSRMMTLPVLRKLHALASAGATIVGTRPQASPSLADDPAVFETEATAVFGAVGETAPRVVGKGRVFSSGSLPEALAALHLARDFEYAKPQPDSKILFTHRTLKDGEIYFVSNRRDRPQAFTATFRVSGYRPELWNPIDGTTRTASAVAADDRTQVALSLPAFGSTFVVFRRHGHPTPASTSRDTVVATLSGPWDVAFQPGRGAPRRLTLPKLTWWNDSAIEGVRYFSGSAEYTKHFNLPAAALAGGAHLYLDLGDVREIAEVTLNGRSVGAVWAPPYRLDITAAAKAGNNRLGIKVANLWVNRLIGDAQATPGRKYSFTIIPTYRADAPLHPSGLRGDMRIVQTIFDNK